MTQDELKLHYDLKPCTNKEHFFEIGRLLISFQWANDKWSQLVGDKLQTLHFAFTSTTNINGTSIYSFAFWRLKVIVGILTKWKSEC